MKAEIKAPFFEIGPKSYLYGDDVLNLALAANEASKKYKVQIIFTSPLLELRRVSENCKNLIVCCPHMDPIIPGRGLADTLPEAVKAAGADAVMLNHAEKPITYSVLRKTILRADEMDLLSIVCADSVAETKAAALLRPDIIVAEPSDLIGTGTASDFDYVRKTIQAVKDIDPRILVLQGAGISNGEDVYRVIRAGAEATGSSSGIVKAPDPEKMIFEMIGAVRAAWDDRHADCA